MRARGGGVSEVREAFIDSADSGAYSAGGIRVYLYERRIIR